MNEIQNDEYYMKEAIKIGQEALEQNEVPVGCVIVDEHGQIVATGRNHTKEFQDGTQHAELICIDQLLAKKINMKRCILYVTCEPCIMCAEALKQCGINKIIYGCSNQRFGGCGSILTVINSSLYPSSLDKSHSSPDRFSESFSFCFHSFMEKEGLDLLQQFFSMTNSNAPPELRKQKKN